MISNMILTWTTTMMDIRVGGSTSFRLPCVNGAAFPSRRILDVAQFEEGLSPQSFYCDSVLLIMFGFYFCRLLLQASAISLNNSQSLRHHTLLWCSV